jgi:hypothetical protein
MEDPDVGLDAVPGSRFFWPVGNETDIYKQLGISLDQVDVFYRYGWRADVPSLMEIFSLYAKDSAVLLNFSGGMPLRLEQIAEILGLKTVFSEREQGSFNILKKA